MSRLSEDLDALRAMAIAQMAPASIAKMLGRSEAWVDRQLLLLDGVVAREVETAAKGMAAICRVIRKVQREAGGFAVAASWLARERLTVDPAAPAPAASAELGGVVERSFHTTGGRYGAAVPLADGRLAFVDTLHRLVVGSSVEVVSRDGRFGLAA